MQSSRTGLGHHVCHLCGESRGKVGKVRSCLALVLICTCSPEHYLLLASHET